MTYMNVVIPAFEDITEVNPWVPPQPSSLMLLITDRNSKEHHIDFLPTYESVDQEFPKDSMRLRRVFINQYRMKIGSEEELAAVELLRKIYEAKMLGIPDNLENLMAKECLEYYKRLKN